MRVTPLVLVMLCRAAQLHAADAPPADATRTEQAIQAAIIDLNSPEFDVRERATEVLRQSGSAAVPLLVAATKSASRETAIRAADVLAHLYRTESAPLVTEVENVISDLRNAPGAVGDLAQRSWDANALNREERTVAQLEGMGAGVKFRNEADPSVDPLLPQPRKPAIQMVIIKRAWTGGDKGLELLSRLTNKPEIQIYVVNGAKVSEEAMQGIADLGFRVDRRGAFLGISSGGGTRFFGQPNVCEIAAVNKDSPADKAGLLPRDIIIKFDDEPVADFEGLIGLLKETQPGDKVPIEVHRDGQELRMVVELGDWD